MECELAEITETENLHAVVGRIVNVSADEKVLSENGKIDPVKLN
jgi:flavin reductase (DIM6/NTAB) family NADH-FMN oxidoreductase RutF